MAANSTKLDSAGMARRKMLTREESGIKMKTDWELDGKGKPAEPKSNLTWSKLDWD